jgi:DNA polymerase-3 subunit chi
MGAAYFYHLTREPLERSLPQLLSKARGAGWICQVIGPDPDQLAALDASLWRGPPAEFLAHGLAGGPNDTDQPILLSTARISQHPATCVMCIGGAEISASDVAALDRTCILFDGNDEAALQTARAQWKSLTDAGCAAQYWSQADGPWQKKAEKNTPAA